MSRAGFSGLHQNVCREVAKRFCVRIRLRLICAGVALATTVIVGDLVGGPRPQATTLEAVAQSAPAPTPAPALPGIPATPRATGELRRVLADAMTRFEAMDAAGVLAHVSDQYRTSPMTKPLLRDQLVALFTLYDEVRFRARIDEVRMVGEHAWVWSTGEVTGRLALVGRWMPVLVWERELEVARLENGRWRLYGYQQ